MPYDCTCEIIIIVTPNESIREINIVNNVKRDFCLNFDVTSKKIFQ